MTIDETTIEDAANFHKVMRCLKNMRRKHGLCQPRERKACTACNAKDELEQITKAYKGERIYPSDQVASAHSDKEECGSNTLPQR